MSKTISVTPVYNRKNQLNTKGEALVQVRMYYENTNKYLSTGIYLEPKHWDDKRLRVKPSHKKCIDLNITIHRKVEEIETWFIERRADGFEPTILDIYNYAKHGDRSSSLFLDWMKKEIPIHAVGKYTKSESQYNSTYFKLRQFNAEVRFRDFNFKYLSKLSYWLANTYTKSDGQYLHPTSIHKVFKHLKLFITIATKQGVCDPKHNPFMAGFKISEFVKKVESKPKFLTLDELNRIEIFSDTLEEGAMKKVTECFLFQCYTGFRHTDLASVKKSDIIISPDKTYINKTQNKTQNAVSIPISILFNGVGMPILNKYLSKCINDDSLVFPNINQQYYNRELKLVQKACQIKMSLTSHVGRHTFGTLLTSIGVPAADISSLMGHKNIMTTMIYAKIITNDRDARLGGFFK